MDLLWEKKFRSFALGGWGGRGVDGVADLSVGGRRKGGIGWRDAQMEN